MVNFLLFLSITLNLLGFLCIILLYLRQNKLINMERVQAKNLEEMEDVISSFVEQIKAENDQFIEKITTMKPKEPKISSPKKIELDKAIEFKPKVLKTNKAYLDKYKSTQQETFPRGGQADKIENDDMEELLNLILPAEKVEVKELEVEKEKTLLDQAVELQEQGKTIEDIARKLDKGKTEIELLLKFRQI